MTILFDIFKQFLTHEVTSIRDTSIGADQSLTNSAAGFLGYGRDGELSAIKHQLLDNLLRDIQQNKFGSDDATIFKQIQQLIEECRAAAMTAAGKRGYPEGATEIALQKLIHITQLIFDRFSTIKLLDLPHDTSPLNLFRYQIARYCSQKIIEAHISSVLSHITHHPRISTLKKLSDEKEGLVLEHLQSCMCDLASLSQAHERYHEVSQKMVVNCIEEIRRKNRALCETHRAELRVPLKLFEAAIPLPFMVPSPGLLEECMQQALTDIATASNTPTAAVAP